MPVLRAVLLAVGTVMFVVAVSLVFVRDTGPAEKVVLVAAAVLITLAVPRIQRLGSSPTPR